MVFMLLLSFNAFTGYHGDFANAIVFMNFYWLYAIFVMFRMSFRKIKGYRHRWNGPVPGTAGVSGCPVRELHAQKDCPDCLAAKQRLKRAGLPTRVLRSAIEPQPGDCFSAGSD